jgi:hypothetical protein
MLPFVQRTPAKTSLEPLPGGMQGEHGKRIADIMNGVAETLSRSCLYFSPDNLAVLGPGPDVNAMLERLDPLIRAALLNDTLRPEQRHNFRAFAECPNELKAGADAARLAAQIFRLLHEAQTPASGMAPLKRLTDSALRTLRTAASALASGDASAAHMARKSLAETEAIGRKIMELIPALAAYRPAAHCRLMAAAVYAVLVSAHAITEVAANLLLPPAREIAPLGKLDEPERFCRVTGMPHRASSSRDDVLCMPVRGKR